MGHHFRISFVEVLREESLTEHKICEVLLKHLSKVLVLAVFLEKLCFWKSVQTDWNRDLRSSRGVESTFLCSKFSLSFCPASEESTLHSDCLGKTEQVAVFLRTRFFLLFQQNKCHWGQCLGLSGKKRLEISVQCNALTYVGSSNRQKKVLHSLEEEKLFRNLHYCSLLY